MKEKKGNQFRAPQNQQDALTLALKLAISAPSKGDLDRVTEITAALLTAASSCTVDRQADRPRMREGLVAFRSTGD